MKQPGPFTRITQRQVSSLETIKCVSALFGSKISGHWVSVNSKGNKIKFNKTCDHSQTPRSVHWQRHSFYTSRGSHSWFSYSIDNFSHGMQHSYLAWAVFSFWDSSQTMLPQTWTAEVSGNYYTYECLEVSFFLM